MISAIEIVWVCSIIFSIFVLNCIHSIMTDHCCSEQDIPDSELNEIRVEASTVDVIE